MWIEATDENGNAYYVNDATGATSWTNPELDDADDGEWVEQDDGQGNVYYMHTGTYETRWDRPQEMDKPPPLPSAVIGAPKVPPSKEQVASSDVTEEMQRKMNALKAQFKNGGDPQLQVKIDEAKRTQELASKSRDEAVANGAELWVEVYDPESESFYYYGSYGHDITWEQPEDYVMAADDAFMSAVIKIQCAFRSKLARTKVKRTRERQKQKWVQTRDGDQGDTVYYYNTETNEVQDTPPAEYRPGATPSATILDKMRQTLEGKVKKVDLELAAKVKKAKDEADGTTAQLTVRWVSVFDPATESFYYYDPATQSSTWQQPQEFVESADDETMSAVIKIQCAFRTRMARRTVDKKRAEQVLLPTKKEPQQPSQPHSRPVQQDVETVEKRDAIKHAADVKLGSTKTESQEKELKEKRKLLEDMNSKEEQMLRELEEIKKRKEEKKRLAHEARRREEAEEKKKAEEDEKRRLRDQRELEKQRNEEERQRQLEQKRIETENRGKEKQRALEEMERKRNEHLRAESKAKEDARLQRIRDQQVRDAQRHKQREQEQRTKSHEVVRLQSMFADGRARAIEDEEELLEWKRSWTTASLRASTQLDEHESGNTVPITCWDAIHYTVSAQSFQEMVQHALEHPADNRLVAQLHVQQINKRLVRAAETARGGLQADLGKSDAATLEQSGPIEWQHADVLYREHEARLQYLQKQLDEVMMLSPPVDQSAQVQQKLVCWRNDEGDTLLHGAAWNGCVEKVKYLLSLGADVNAIDSSVNRTTALHEAVRGQHIGVVELLLSAGARVDLADGSGDVPLHLACRRSHRKMAHLLITADWSGLRTLSALNYKKRTPKDLATKGPILDLLTVVQSELDGRNAIEIRKRQKEELRAKTYKKKQRKGMNALQSHIRSIRTLRDS